MVKFPDDHEPPVSAPLSNTARWRLRAFRDPLTGLLNVRYLRVQLARRGAAARRTLLLAADLVGLGDIDAGAGNETAHGVLRRVGRAFREVVGYDGLLFHVGWGTFVATFLHGDAERAVSVVRGFREAVRYAHPALGVVFGWAAAPCEGAELDELSRVAFDRMNASRERKTGDTRLLAAGGGP